MTPLREQFEVFAVNQGMQPHELARDTDGEYRSLLVRMAFKYFCFGAMSYDSAMREWQHLEADDKVRFASFYSRPVPPQWWSDDAIDN